MTLMDLHPLEVYPRCDLLLAEHGMHCIVRDAINLGLDLSRG